jgi:PAS domain S-box-containing protein
MLPPTSGPDRRYQAIFEAAGMGICVASLDGLIREVNTRFAAILGRPRASLIGLHVHDITHPDDVHAGQAFMEATLRGRTEHQSIEKRYLRPDGQAVHVVLSLSLLRDEAGHAQEFIGVVEDITERLRMEEALSNALAAERASKAKTEFLSRMSHELRTPLNAMLGFAQLLRVDVRHPLSEAQRDKVEHIERAGAHLLAMMTDVLDLSRIEAGGLPMCPEPLDVAACMNEALALVTNQAAAAGLHALLHLPQDELHVLADQLRLRQVLVNLLSNAIKYNRPGGQLRLEAMPMGRELLFVVSDTGKGMNAEQLAHLFEPFNRLGAERTAVEGTGIGLVIVRRLVELMHGRIEVSSTPGVGSSFRVWLPMADADHVMAAGKEHGPRSGFGGLDELGKHTRVLLYAEDNAVNVELLREVMGMRPHWHLDIARSGQQAIDMVRASPPDLLLLDMHLGDMTGLEVSDILACDPALATIPRVALSADAMPDQISAARERGFADYLTKPVDVSRFLMLLDACG